MEKKEIKKLELPYCNPGTGSYASGASNIEIIDKINQIIDLLNSQRELVISKEDCKKIKEGLRGRLDYRNRLSI